MDENVIRDVYQLDIDSSALTRVKQGIAAGRKAIEDMTSTVKSQPAAFDGAAKAAANYAKAVEQSDAKIAASRKKLAEEADKQASGGSAQKLFSTGSQIAGALGGGGVVGQAISTAGGVTDAVRELPKLTEALKGLSPSALAAGGATAGLVIAIDAYTHAQEAAKQAALSDIEARQRVLALTQTGSKADIQTRLDQLAQQQKVNQDAAKDAQALFQGIKDETLKNLGPAAAALEFYAAGVGKASGQYQGAYEAANKASTAVNSTNLELELLEKQSGLTARSIEEVSKSLSSAAFITSDMQNRVSAAQEAYNVELSGTSESLAKRKNDLQNFITINESAITEARNRLATEKLSVEEQKALSDGIDALTKQSNNYKTTLAFLSDTFVSSTIASREAAEFAKKQDAEKITAVKTFNDQEKKITAENNKAKADALDRLNAAQVSAAETAAKAAENALQTLIDKKAQLSQGLADAFIDDETKAKRAEFDAQIKIQQEEVKASREHHRTLAKIQKDGIRDEQKALDDRDFARLFEIRSQRKDQIDEENQTFIEQRQDANEAAALEASDRTRHNAEERSDRLTNYQRAIRDAQAQYTKETQQADANKRQQLNLAQQAYTAIINQLQNKLITEQRLNQSALDTALKNANTSAGQRIAIEQKVTDAFLAQANKRLAAISGGTGSGAAGSGTSSGRVTATRAVGGTLNAFQASTYNETAGQREKWNRMMLPDGSGMIIPFRPGFMDSNGGGKAVTINGPLVAPTIQVGNANSAQIGNLKQAIFEGALDALQVVTNAKVGATP